MRVAGHFSPQLDIGRSHIGNLSHEVELLLLFLLLLFFRRLFLKVLRGPFLNGVCLPGGYLLFGRYSYRDEYKEFIAPKGKLFFLALLIVHYLRFQCCSSLLQRFSYLYYTVSFLGPYSKIFLLRSEPNSGTVFYIFFSFYSFLG